MLANFQRDFTNMLKSDTTTSPADYFDDKYLFLQEGDILNNRLLIYRNNVQQSLRNLLKTTYMRCYVILGHDNFMFLAQEFVKNNIPEQAKLSAYGSGFVKFLKENNHVQKEYPWLADLAILEWAYQESFFAGNLSKKSIDIDNIANLLQSRFLLHPSLSLKADISSIAIDAMQVMQYDDNISIHDMQHMDSNIKFCQYAHDNTAPKYHVMIARGSISTIFHRAITQPT